MTVNSLAGESLVYFGTYTGAKSQGIYVSRFDCVTGKLSAPELVAETKNPTFLAVAPGGNFLYAVSEVDAIGGQRTGAVDAFALDAKTAKLTPLNGQNSGGSGPCHIAVDATDKCFARCELWRRQHRRTAHQCRWQLGRSSDKNPTHGSQRERQPPGRSACTFHFPRAGQPFHARLRSRSGQNFH